MTSIEESRREFFAGAARFGLAAGLAALAAFFGVRRQVQACAPGACPACPIREGCANRIETAP